MFCQYADIFGKPREGVHSLRVFDVAIVDVIFTILASLYLSKMYKISFQKLLVYSCIFGFILHSVFCVKTKILS